jgi:hypothetical protein
MGAAALFATRPNRVTTHSDCGGQDAWNSPMSVLLIARVVRLAAGLPIYTTVVKIFFAPCKKKLLHSCSWMT